ncbi:hypothetical protein H310_08875 [Aphanomyces invadans]|uniref:U6 small nuclear RNA (adenine-(43)-N(6))-methyltransferase n=1 Tax=Aphanomyces invadans TaxID=157072 RepID=A0A024TXP4_9STRA|nr:hypothetical protein H310_08875 [Aphanomyces invadans]ETV98132.1 hypothetical protein H310_08875 [Aphanomyces invadans]|eukprot:XP_008873007.1 hypothetical protein H310_08875 [Aphanomyces invadans]
MRGEKRKRTVVNNDGIHPRNMYRTPPDFEGLAKAYPSLQPYVRQSSNGTCSFQWNDPQAARELTKSLLHRDFGVTWDIPLNRLCPPLTNRLNYIHWIEDLILLSRSTYTATSDEGPIWGIDIGTGASCIYPLLGHSLNQWNFIATDIDALSLRYATANVESNNLSHAIHVEAVAPDAPSVLLIKSIATHASPILFSMCNPPFFDSVEEADTNPRTACTGSHGEMTTPGGEVAFISTMIQDSLVLHTKVRWYTSLIGRKSSLRPLLALLRSHGVCNMRTTEFLQGRTTRWGLAWSFTSDGHGSERQHSHKVLAKRRESKRRQELTFRVDQTDTSECVSLDLVHRRILDSAALVHMSEMDLAVTEGSSDQHGQPRRRMYMIEATRAGDGHRVLLFQAAVCAEATAVADNAGHRHECVDVALVWQQGVARDQFWTFSDKWKGAILRSGRRWRKAARPPCEGVARLGDAAAEQHDELKV